MDTTTCVSHLLAALLRTLLVALLVFGGASSAQPPTLPTAASSTQQEANPTLRDTILADQELSAHPLSATDNLTVGEAVSSLTLDVPQRTLEQAGVDPDAYNDLATRQGPDRLGVWRGTYEDNSLGNSFWLFAAPVVAPVWLRTLSTAYTFPLDTLLDTSTKKQRDALKKRIARGELGLATYNGQNRTYGIALPGSAVWRDGVEHCATCDADGVANYNTSLRVIGPDADLFGVRSAGRVVAWDADQPLDEVVLGNYRDILKRLLKEAARSEKESDQSGR